MDTKASKEEKIRNFDPNGVGDVNANIFGLPFSFEESEVVLLPVPWEVTVSYTPGTAKGPEAILDASYQVDLHDPDLQDAWKHGIYMLDASAELMQKSNHLRNKAYEIIRYMEKGGDISKNAGLTKSQQEINQASEEMVHWVHEQTSNLLNHNKLVGLVGGDHSTPLGFIKALANKYDDFGILQIDAHFDLREAYEGFKYSHASIMYNAMNIKSISKILSLGIRDFSQGEMEILNKSNGKLETYTDRDIRYRQFEGDSWKMICTEIASKLPQNIYISFDIDGLDPKLCPATGTPVAGGFEMAEINYLLKTLVDNGKKIIGFDLVEVAPGDDEWNGNVGARLLYKLCNLMLKSQTLK